MNMRLKDKAALITGAGSGIGRCTALGMAKEGALIGVNDISPQAVEQTLEEVRKLNARGLALPADVTDVDQVKGMFEKLKAEWGTIDILVNNAGIFNYDEELQRRREAALVKAAHEVRTSGKVQESLKMTSAFKLEWWHKIIDVNLNSVFYCTREALKIMEEKRTGKIINMASVAGMIGAPPNIAYGAAKGAVIAFTKSLAKEVIGSGIHVNAVAPGVIDTPLFDKNDASLPMTLAQIPMGRLGTPEEIAGVVIYLASDEADYFVGQIISPNGGVVV